MTSTCLLKGSCHCQRIKFQLESNTPCPFIVCHCQTDTKTAGIYTSNIMGNTDTLKIQDPERNLRLYQREITDETGKKSLSLHKRHFCAHCASYLWASDERWAQWVWPFASAIDTPLPMIPDKDQLHIFLESNLPHVKLPEGVIKEHIFPQYPHKDTSIEKWHKENPQFMEEWLKKHPELKVDK